MWAHSGIGVASVEDFWSTLHSGNLTIVRDVVAATTTGGVRLGSGSCVGTDYLIMCTGWGDHFSFFDRQQKAVIGLPVYGVHDQGHHPDAIDWAPYDREADRLVDQQLPFLSKPPALARANLVDPADQKHWRLYRRIAPVSMADKGDNSLIVLGQIHTIQSPLVFEMSAFWGTLYLLGHVVTPNLDTMAKEVALWNAWTRKRYLLQGKKHPYSIYDFIPVSAPSPLRAGLLATKVC